MRMVCCGKFGQGGVSVADDGGVDIVATRWMNEEPAAGRSMALWPPFW